MKAGRKPKSTVLKVLTGNPGKRPLNFSEPRPKRGAPPAPEWLGDYARAEWDRIVPELDAIGLLTVVDGFILEAYVTAYGHWREHEEVLRNLCDSELGHACRPRPNNPNYIQALPQVAIAQRYLATTRALASELGLSPASRAGLQAPLPNDPDDDPLEKFFRRQGR